MKILYYSPHPHLNLMSPSGYGTHMREMIKAFEKEGCQVLPVIMGGVRTSAELAENTKKSGIKAKIKKFLPRNIWRSMKDLNLLRFDRINAANRIGKAVDEFQPDIIYERCNYLQLSGVKAADKYGVPHAMEINSPYVEESNDLSGSTSYLESFARHIECKQLAGTDVAVAVVTPLKNYLCSQCQINPEKFIVTHNTFNSDSIVLNKQHQRAITQKYDLAGQTVIGFVGSIFEWHGLDILIKAVDRLAQPNVKLIIVGYGEYMIHLKELTTSLGLDEQVIFTGRVPREQVFDYIKLMDICAAPNAAWYQSPVKIFEYGAMGKPILGPDTEAVREIMESGEDGILIKPTLEDTLAGLNRILDYEQKAAAMAHHFQQKVLKEYTWQRNARKVLNKISVKIQ